MCTTINVKSPEGNVLARTMDFEKPLDFNGLHIPRDHELFVDLEGKVQKSKYRALGIVFYNHIPLKDGINEYGLAGSTNYFHYMNNHSSVLHEGKVNMTSLHYLNYVLTNYKSIDEIVEDSENIHIAFRNSRGENEICPDFHHMFTDRTGRSLIVEPYKKEYKLYENPYDVMTNSPAFEKHVKKLNETFDIDNLDKFNSSKNLPGGYDPVSRFIKAYYLLRTQVKSSSQKEALSNAYNIMDALNLPHGFIWSNADNHHIYTRYISAYDTRNLKMTARSFSNPRIYEAGFDDFNEDELLYFNFNMDFTTDKFF